MAATGKTPILLYGSTTATNTPVAGNLTNSSDGCEIAVNVADGKLFYKNPSNVVSQFGITFGSTAQTLGSTVSALNGVSVGQSSAAAGTFTTLTNTTGGSLAGDFTVGGSAYPNFKASAGNAAYIKIDDTANAGGKLWRIGDGVYSFGMFSIYNQTDNTFPFDIVASTNDVKVNLGNLVIGTSGKGIDFSATAGTGTSELLADYEEGTWTPAWSVSGGTITSYGAEGTYTKIGNRVLCTGYIAYGNAVTGTPTGQLSISGLPYTANATGVGQAGNRYSGHILASSLYWTANAPDAGWIPANSTTFYLFSQGATGVASTTYANMSRAFNNSDQIYFEVLYYV